MTSCQSPETESRAAGHTIPRAAIYCRLSEEDRNKRSADVDSNSIQNQKAMLLQYSLEQNWEVYDLYSDDDYTGSDRNRPEFQRLLRDAEEHRFDIVLCKTQSRFTRELELVEKYIHGLFPLWGIRFVSVVDNADTASRGNKKSRQINGLVNEWYLEDMSENIRSVLTSRRLRGLHIGSFALYGYKKDPERRGHLIIDEQAAAVVREVFTLFSQGMGKTAIARQLNDRGVPSPSVYKRLQGLRSRQPEEKCSGLWKYAAIASMLRNEIYTGNMVQGKYGSVSYKTKQNRPRPPSVWYRVENTHDAIIDRVLWEQVQSMLAQRTRPFSSGNVGIFARKVRCAACGYTMCSSKNRGRHYLRCSSRRAASNACTGAFISVEKLERIVLEELERLSGAYLDMEELEKLVELPGDLEEEKKRLLADCAAYEQQRAVYKNCVRKLYLDRIKGRITESDFLDLSREFSTERARLENLVDSIQAQLREIEDRSTESSSPRIAEYLHPKHLRREMVEILIDYISVGRRAPGAKDPPVEIHWKF